MNFVTANYSKCISTFTRKFDNYLIMYYLSITSGLKIISHSFFLWRNSPAWA